MAWLLNVGLIGSGALIGGLAVVYGGPFLFRTVELDESDPQREATITVSDPQLYARETLINDRRDEFEYLTKLLTESADPNKVQFPPQVIRDMSVLEAFKNEGRVQLAGGAEPNTNSEMPKPLPLNTSNAQTGIPGTPEANTQGANSKTVFSKPTTSPQEEFRDRQAYRGDLRAALASVNLDDLHDLAGNALFRLQFKVSAFPGQIKNKFGVAQLTVQPPRLELQAISSIYRVWLGHVSSRINYIMNGKLVSDPQFSISGMAPYLKVIKLGAPMTPKGTGEKDRCLALTPTDLAFAKQNNDFLRGEYIPCYTLSLSVPPDSPTPDWLYSTRDAILLNAADLLSQANGNQGDIAAFCQFAGEVLRPQLLALSETAVAVLKIEPSLEAALDGLIAGSDQIDRRRVLAGGPSNGLQDLQDQKTDYQNLSAAAADLRSYLAKVAAAANAVITAPDKLKDCGVPLPTLPTTGKAVGLDAPDAFVDILTEPSNPTDKDKRRVAKGYAYAFGTTPIELAQRLSTTTSTAASMQLALALSSKLQAESSKALAGSDYMRSMAQTAAFFERIPLVVGFSDRKEEQANPQPAEGQAKLPASPTAGGAAPIDAQSHDPRRYPKFGWVFGPKARFDTARQRFVFEQSIGNYDVAADISVPSWWPRVDLKVDTAWIANWYEASDVVKQSREAPSPRSISVPLPLNRTDLDGLTKFLMQDVRRSSETTAVTFVEPSVISACANEVTILIYGANVWRSAEVYLGGLRSKEIKVLPDMEGISAKFDLAGFYKNRNTLTNPLGYEEAVLRINTRNGKDSQLIRIVGDRQPARTNDTKDAKELAVDCTSPYSVAGPILRHQQSLTPTILAVAPSSLDRCSGTARLVLTGRNLMATQPGLTSQLAPPQVFLNGVAGKAEQVSLSQKPDDLQVISVTFDLSSSGPQTGNVNLIVLNATGFATANLGSCGGPQNNGRAPTPPNTPPPTTPAPQGAAPK